MKKKKKKMVNHTKSRRKKDRPNDATVNPDPDGLKLRKREIAKNEGKK